MIIQILETDVFRLIFPWKGGSRSICDKFGCKQGENFIQISELNEYLNNSKNNILVLRKPKDRFMSAYRMAQYLQTKKESYLRDFEHMLSLHGEPYINKISTKVKFNYILFEELSFYGFKNIGSPEKNRFPKRKWNDEFDNMYDFACEQKAYDNFIQNNEKLKPEIFYKWFLESTCVNAKKYRLSRLNYAPLKLAGE